MKFCCVDEQDRLLAVIERIGNGRPQSPVRWLLRWSLRESAAGRQDSFHSDRWEAVSVVKRVCPHAALQVFDRHGLRIR